MKGKILISAICLMGGLAAVGVIAGIFGTTGVSVTGPYVHHIDPVIVTVFGIHLWWYGLSYTLGFLNAHFYLRRNRARLGFSIRSVYNLSLLLAAGVLLGGRLVEVAFYEWPFYREHSVLIPAYWLGGMATHGLLLGGLMGVWVFGRIGNRSFFIITDALVVPAAVIMALGRIGNFIDGQIVGSVSTAWWAVKFPDADEFRHPVVFYDGLKNLLLVPILIYFGKLQKPGVQTGIFLFFYAFLRIFVDMFRVYPTSLWGFATGQVLNILMSAAGLALIILTSRKCPRVPEGAPLAIATPESKLAGARWHWLAFVAILLFSLVIPSDSTQDIPSRYGKRHAGLHYSAIYPPIGDVFAAGTPDDNRGSKIQKKMLPK